MQFGILGPLRVVDGGRPIDLGAHRQRSVLAILVLHADEVVSLDRLVDLLWGETPPNAATGSLQAYVSNLRRALEPERKPREPARLLVTEAPGYRLRVDRDAVDAFRFERLVGEGRALLADGDAPAAVARLDEALSLWRGEALAEFRYEPFAAIDTARLDDLRVVAEGDHVEALLAAGDHAAALRSLDRILPLHPLRERLRGLHMVALYRAGRQADALRTYDEARRLLAEELGIAPGPQLQQLFGLVLDQSPALLAAQVGAAPVAAGAPPGGGADGAPRPTGALRASEAVTFVGRARELAACRLAVADVLAGRSRVVLVGGEPGVGKSRLAEEVAAEAAAAGGRAVWGRCHDDDGFPALWPWVQVVRALRGAHGEGQGSEASLARLLGFDDDTAADNVKLARYRLYERLRSLLEEEAATAPVVVVLDDLQWADPSSLRLLRYLAAELRGIPVLVIGTFHEPDGAGDAPLTRALADLARQPSVARLSLAGLEVGDVTDLVRADTLVDDSAVDRVAAELHRRTDGNAFFLTELVRLLQSEHTLQRADEASDIPLAVRDVVRRRVGRLPDDVHAVLGVAAVVGREFTLEVLHVAAGLTANEAFEYLEAAIMARVVVETDPGCYRFAHGLVRESLDAELSPSRRARLHAKVAEAMERVYGAAVDQHAGQVAHHHLAAGDAAAASRYSELAAEQSERGLAYDDAVNHWEAALRGAVDEATHARLLLRLAAAHRGAGDARTSVDVHDRALLAAEASGDVDLMTEAALAYGEVGLWQVRPYGTVDERVVGTISDLLGRPDAPNGPRRARLLCGLGVALYYRESERERGRALVREAVEAARDAGRPQLLAASLVELLVMLEGVADPIEQQAVAAELSAVLDADLPFDIESTARMRLARLRLAWGDAAGLGQAIDDVRRRAEEERQPIVQLWITWARTAVAFLAGRLDEAERLAGAAFEKHDELGIWGGPETYAVHMALIWREQGRLSEVSPMVEPLLEESQHPGAYKLRALFALERDDVDDIGTILGPDPVPAVRDFTWLVEMCLTAELCAAARLPACERLYAELRPFAGQVATMDGTYVCLGPVSHYLGLLAAALGRTDEAVAHLEDAVALNERIGAAPFAVRTQFHLAELLAGTAARDALLATALRTASASGLVSMRQRIVAAVDAPARRR